MEKHSLNSTSPIKKTVMGSIILGINCGHDATAVLLKEGRVVGGVAEERLTRNKLQIGFPWLAIPEVLRLSGVLPSEVDTVVIPHQQYLKAHPFFVNLIIDNNRNIIDVGNELSLLSLIKEGMYQLKKKRRISFSISKTVNSNYAKDYFRRSLRSLGIFASLVSKDHHMAHAASAYYTSGFDECLVITADGSGDGLSHTTCIGKNGELTRLYSTPIQYSLGVFYSAITKFLGFKRHKHEGKITALAAYGNPNKLYSEFCKIICLSEDGISFYSKIDYSFSCYDKIKWGTKLVKGNYFRSNVTNYLLGIFENTLSHEKPEDIAAAAQKCLEDVMVDLVSNMAKKTGLKRIALGGGIFGNVKLNQRILALPEVDEVFIHPNMGDGGTALGGAYLHWVDCLKEKGERMLPERIRDVYWGTEYSDKEIHEEIQRRGIEVTYYEDVESKIAEFLSKGFVVGRFNGKMEYGPRALGNRSILSQATDPSTKDWLNNRLKRTEFMPFAPTILYEYASEFYEEMPKALYPSEFMTIACSVKKEVSKRAPAVQHVDYTARPHVVKKEVNETYYRIIDQYRKITGLPLILNTSFNTHEHPIVCSPRDAIDSFLQESVDILAIGNFILLSYESKKKL